jgi:hypothetical protein
MCCKQNLNPHYTSRLRNQFQSVEFGISKGVKFSIHMVQYDIRISRFVFLTVGDIFPCCLITCQCVILCVFSPQKNTRSMTSEEERLPRLRRTLHSLATRVSKIILIWVDSTFPVLKVKALSVFIELRIYVLRFLHDIVVYM